MKRILVIISVVLFFSLYGIVQTAETFAQVTLNEIEKAYIANHPVITASNEQKWAPFNFFEDGKPKGFSIDYLNLLADKVGMKVKYISGPSWKEFIELSKNREIDVLLNVAYNEERTAWLEFLDRPYFGVHYGLVINTDRSDIGQYKDILDKSIAVEDGFWMHDWLNKNHPQARLAPYKNTMEALIAVSLNEADVYVGNVSVCGYLINKNWLTNLRVIPLGETKLKKSNDLYIAVPKGMVMLKSILDKAMAAVTDEEVNRLAAKWLLQESAEKDGVTIRKRNKEEQYYLALSNAEREYLGTKKQISMCIDPNWAPYEMIDENGNYIGLTADYFEVFQQMIPVPIKLVKTSTWDESVQLAKARKCDILSMLNKSPERSKYLNFTEPYIRANVVLIAREDVVYLDGLESLYGKTLAIVRSYVYEEIVRNSHPKIKIVMVDNLAEGLQKVSDGSVFASIGSLLTVLPQIQELGLTNLKIAGPANLKNEFRIGARNDEAELVSIFDKAVKAIDQDTESQILRRWYTVSVEKSFDYSLIWKITGASLFAIVIVLYWNRRLSNMARKIKKAKDEAEAANRAKSVFLANMSHEIRTPLNAVIGFSELLKHTEITPKQQSYLQSIHTGGKTLLSLINDILDLSKIEADKMIIKTESVNIRQIMVDIEMIFAYEVKEKALNFTLSIHEDVPEYLMLDETRFRQVLFNIVGNAIKFTKEGRVDLSVKARSCESAQNTVDLTVEIQDTGIGIPQDQHETIFGSFEQQQGQSAQKYGGTGLGLSISNKLVKLMGGQIILESSSGLGSTFVILFHQVAIGNERFSDVEQGVDLVGKVRFSPATVLIADDVHSNRQLAKNVLVEHGLTVVEAVHGAEVVMMAKEFEPDLILMDIRMPNMDGMEATRQIKASPWGGTPIIALTAGAQFEADKELFQGVLEKPITPSEMLSELVGHLASEVIEAGEIYKNTVSLKDVDKVSISRILDESLQSSWSQAFESGAFEDIRAFANSLHASARNHKEKQLVDFAIAMKESVESFDARKLKEMLVEVGELLQTGKEGSHGE